MRSNAPFGVRAGLVFGLSCAVVAVGCGDDSNASDSTPMAGSPGSAGSALAAWEQAARMPRAVPAAMRPARAAARVGRRGSGGTAAGSGGTTGGSGGAAGSADAGSGGTAAGSGGSGGTVAVPPGELEDAPIGWASVAGDSVNTTTGGGNGETVRPTSAQQLMEYAESEDPLVIRARGHVLGAEPAGDFEQDADRRRRRRHDRRRHPHARHDDEASSAT